MSVAHLAAYKLGYELNVRATLLMIKKAGTVYIFWIHLLVQLNQTVRSLITYKLI